MNKWTVILAVTLLLLLGSVFHVYGYWMNRLESDWTIPVAYPVTVSVLSEDDDTLEDSVLLPPHLASSSDMEGGG